MSVPTEKELQELQELTRMTGRLSNVQMAQLKMWPRIILMANNAEVEFDPDERYLAVDVSDLDYDTMTRGATEDAVTLYMRRMAKFDHAVKYLLGREYLVVVKLKGNVLARFPPLTMPEGAHPPKPEAE